MSEYKESNQDIVQKVEKQSEKQVEKQSEKDYYQQSLKDGYKGILGAIIGTLAAEIILWFGQTESVPSWLPQFRQVDDNMPLIFAAIGLMYTFRHLAQIWQAKIQLKQLLLDEQAIRID